MKILFFIDGLYAGGKERRLVELIKGLRNKAGIEFELILMSKDVHYREVFDLGITIRYFIRRSKKDFAIFKMLYNYCKSYKPDVIQCCDSMTAIYATPICKFLKIKMINQMVINTPENSTFFNNKEYRRARITFPFSDCIIGNSEAGLAAYAAPRKKSVCIHNGFNFERLNQLESKIKLKEHFGIKAEYVVGMAASFSEFKDYKTFFGAAQLVLEKRKDIVFLAIGSNTDSEDAKKMVQDKHSEHFRFLGKQSNMESLINLIDIGILSTFTEGISNSILEYMALGKPVIATEGGGTNEIVVDGKTGFLVKRANPQELSDKINILLADKSLRLKMGIAAKERILDQFSVEKMIDKYISVYNGLYKNKAE